MSIQTVGNTPSVSYNTLKTGAMSVKGQTSQTQQSTQAQQTAQTAAKTDTVSLSSAATGTQQTYTIGGDTVSKAVYDEYDSNGDGTISADELAAYEAAKNATSSASSQSSQSSQPKQNGASGSMNGAVQAAKTTQSALLGGVGSNVNTYA